MEKHSIRVSIHVIIYLKIIIIGIMIFILFTSILLIPHFITFIHVKHLFYDLYQHGPVGSRPFQLVVPLHNIQLFGNNLEQKVSKDIQPLSFFSFFLNKCELDSIQFVIKSFKFLL